MEDCSRVVVVVVEMMLGDTVRVAEEVALRDVGRTDQASDIVELKTVAGVALVGSFDTGNDVAADCWVQILPKSKIVAVVVPVAVEDAAIEAGTGPPVVLAENIVALL
jgi:hypothetical protein